MKAKAANRRPLVRINVSQDGIGGMQARCWVFGSSEPISGSDPVLSAGLNGFFSQWNSHGASVSGRWKVLEDRFLVVVREPEGAEVSGCSIDSMVGEVKRLEKEMQTRFLDSSRIFYRGARGAVEVATRPEFKALAAAGKITPETEVFDTTVADLSDLRPGIFVKALKDSWHARLLEPPSA